MTSLTPLFYDVTTPVTNPPLQRYTELQIQTTQEASIHARVVFGLEGSVANLEHSLQVFSGLDFRVTGSNTTRTELIPAYPGPDAASRSRKNPRALGGLYP